MAGCILKTNYHSWSTGTLPKGCMQCVQGKKLVLFITGLCAQRCFYCPVSEHKFSKDHVYANEWQIANPNKPKELFEEIKLTDAKGAGITGGDPLVKVDRCVDYIRSLKEHFGKKFHIHLYTPLKLVTTDRLEKLANAGLDEIRFHPNLDDQTLWPNLKLACKYNWKIGIEIPAIPGYEEKTKSLMDFAAGCIDFLNFNELERSDTQAAHYKLDALGYKQKDNVSYGIKGSKEMAFEMLSYAKSKGIVTHFCTAKLKDRVQMSQRLKRRAKNAKLPFDLQTEEGLLFRGCMYLKDLTPGIGYREKIKTSDRKKMNLLLEKAKSKLAKFKTSVVIDHEKYRLLASPKFVKTHAKEIKKTGLVPAHTEEYPTADAIEVSIEFL